MSNVTAILSKKGSFVATAPEDVTVLAATQLMQERRIGSVIVTRGERIVGIFTERDIVNRVVAAGRDPRTTAVRDVMTTPVACCHPDTELEECVALMTDKRLRHLPVVKDGQLCGVVSSGDILALQVREHKQTIEFLQEYMHGRQQA
jgi:CBS domain-containing protein